MSEHRAELLAFLQGERGGLERAAVSGFLLVVELLNEDGEREPVRITSDANGYRLPWHLAQGYAAAAAAIDDFDADDSTR